MPLYSSSQRGRREALLALLLLAAAVAPAPGSVAQAPGERPDLAVREALAAPEDLHVGLAATFVVAVDNLGNGTAAATNASFYLGETLLGNASIPALGPGNSTNVTSPVWTALLGNFTLRVVVDPHDLVNESQEGNNELTLEVRVTPPPPPLPDLLVLDVGPADGAPVLGEPTRFTARVLNAGAGAAGPFQVRFVLDGAVLGNATVLALPAGQGVTAASPAWNATGGEHTIRALVDAAGVVEEVEELNNAFARRFTAAAPRFSGPDLRVSEVLMEPATPKPGDEVRFSALVENPGTPAARFLLVFTLDNVTLNSTELPGLGANASRTVTSAVWKATPGEHLLLVEADPLGGNDSSRLNNGLPFRFTVPRQDQRADLVLEVVTVPVTIDLGDKLRLAASVRNDGSWPSEKTEVRFSVDGKVLGSVALGPLQPGATARVLSPPWNATKGPHAATARVDPKDVVLESDEGNNLYARNLTIPQGAGLERASLPDLAVAKFTWDPADPKPGDEVVLQVRIANTGNRTAGAFVVQFLVDGQVLDRQPVTGVGTVDAVVASRPWKAEAGRHTLGVRLDATEQRAEQEEGNNVAYGVLDLQEKAFFSKPVPAPPPALLLAGLAAAALLARAVRRRGNEE